MAGYLADKMVVKLVAGWVGKMGGNLAASTAERWVDLLAERTVGWKVAQKVSNLVGTTESRSADTMAAG